MMLTCRETTAWTWKAYLAFILPTLRCFHKIITYFLHSKFGLSILPLVLRKYFSKPILISNSSAILVIILMQNKSDYMAEQKHGFLETIKKISNLFGPNFIS